MTQTLAGSGEATPAPARRDRLRRDRVRRLDNTLLSGLLIVLSVSWYYSWYHGGQPIGGRGWADQNTYTGAARRMADFRLPTVAELHFPPVYSMLGAVGAWFWRGDPFWIVSYLLLIASAIFVYRGARAMLSPFFSVLFFVALFAWDLHPRTFDYASELFAIPWNNQVLFFAFAFFFWLYATRATGPIDTKLMIAMGALIGLLVTTREESVIFVVPLGAYYLACRRAPLRSWITVSVAAIVAALPGLIIKYQVLGGIFKVSVRPGESYSGTAAGYFSPSHLWMNLKGIIVNSSWADVATHRSALLQSQPWLWIAPIGLLWLVFSRRTTLLMKGYVVMSGLLCAFYLSGNNMWPGTLKYHCLRYISPAFIAMNLGAVVVVERSWAFARSHLGRARGDAPVTRPARERRPSKMIPADSPGVGA